jgi:tRNA threonylcarbamoyladenosine biosynthesis protein TsaB
LKLLAIETASEACSVALSVDGDTREQFSLAPRGHAELVLPWVKSLLAGAGMRMQDLDAIAFGRGPGSFTSLRIGISVVQGLAWGADLPVVPVSSLQATAQAAFGDDVVAAVVVMDARMQQVYCGAFQANRDGIMLPAGTEQVCDPGDVAHLPVEGFAAVGNGWVRYAPLEQFGRQFVSVHPDTWPTASAVIALAGRWLQDHEALPPEQAQPVYLRDKVAEKPS